MNKFSFELQKLEESNYSLELDLLTVLFLHMFHVLGEVGQSKKVAI